MQMRSETIRNPEVQHKNEKSSAYEKEEDWKTKIQISGLSGANLWRRISIDSTLACAALRGPPHRRSALWSSVGGKVRAADRSRHNEGCVHGFARAEAALTAMKKFGGKLWPYSAAHFCGRNAAKLQTPRFYGTHCEGVNLSSMSPKP